MAKRNCLTAEQRALALLLRRELNYSYRELALKTNMSKTSVQRVVKEGFATIKKKKLKSYQGPRKALTKRDERKLKRAIMQLRERSPNFTVMEVVQRSGISPTIVTYRTFLRFVKRLGYGFFHSRKKGVLTNKDLKIRRKLARSMASKPVDYWTSDVAFYLDGVSLIICVQK